MYNVALMCYRFKDASNKIDPGSEYYLQVQPTRI